ncbi:MAG: hypothetical protein H7327_06950 [Herminiimonas sp.]|nr:hypothetical protein [Herminiimonas sp.]
MPTKQEADQYAADVVEHFDAFVHWAIAHWPNPHTPLVADDFSAGRREISVLLGTRLDAAEDGTSTPRSDAGAMSPSESSDPSAQYVNVNPAPWP